MLHILSFFFRYSLYKDRITAPRIKRILHELNFDILDYGDGAPEDHNTLLYILGLSQVADQHRSFVYVKGQWQIVFLQTGHTERDQILLLLPETGHIWLEHFKESELVHSTGVFRELQAHVFCVCILILSALSRVLRPALACAIALLLFANLAQTSFPPDADTTSVTVGTQESPSTAPAEVTDPTAIPKPSAVYYTGSGNVYHLYRDCYHIVNSIAVHTGTPAQSKKDRCCYTCRKRYIENGSDQDS